MPTPQPIVFVDGEFVPASHAVVSVFDRGFLYGDGVFETMRVYDGRPFRWDQHWQRFEQAAHLLQIALPFSSAALQAVAFDLVQRNQLAESILRMTLTRGQGPRGYSPRGCDHPILVMSLQPWTVSGENRPPTWSLVISSYRMTRGQALTTIKSCNRLLQVLARAEAEATGADEALLLNLEGRVVEGAASNIFLILDSMLVTPPPSEGALPGITRRAVLDIATEKKLQCLERPILLDELERADGVFMTLSSWGIVEVLRIGGAQLRRSLLVGDLQLGLAELVRASS